MIEEVRKFFSMLDKINCWVDGSGVGHFPFQYTPTEFLEFAENDLKQKGPQATGNALANAKRALDCQLDYFIKTYGLSTVATNDGGWSTGKKITLLDDLGIVPKSILHKVNQARNDLEHRYEMPSIMTAENANAVVEIFIAATDMYLYPARYSTYFEIKDGSGLGAPLLANLQLALLQEDSIGAEGKFHDIQFEYQVSSDTNLTDYLYLLTYILHSHRISAPNPQKYFGKFKYISNDQNGA